jgi:hypothetical protein
MKNYKQKKEALIAWLKERKVPTGLNKKEQEEKPFIPKMKRL